MMPSHMHPLIQCYAIISHPRVGHGMQHGMVCQTHVVKRDGGDIVAIQTTYGYIHYAPTYLILPHHMIHPIPSLTLHGRHMG